VNLEPRDTGIPLDVKIAKGKRMKKIAQTEIDFEKSIYDKHYRSIETGWDYMRKNGYAHGGWQMLAKQAVLIRNIHVYIMEIAKALKIDTQKVDEIFTQPTKLPETPPDDLFKCFPSGQEKMIPLNEACFQLSGEGYDITFDPSQIRQYINRHTSYFNYCWTTDPNASKKKGKYLVKKEMLLDILTRFPHQSSAQRKMISQFAEWRKTKGQGHC
jgi:hypothetical protein